VALLQDTNLVNAWGISFSATSPFWISDNGSGLSTLYAVTYDTNGTVQVAKQGLQVGIPGDGTPTGQLFNSTTNFHTNLFRGSPNSCESPICAASREVWPRSKRLNSAKSGKNACYDVPRSSFLAGSTLGGGWLCFHPNQV
jgi:hypothetical protein